MTDLWTFAATPGPIITAGQEVIVDDTAYPWDRDKDTIPGLVRVIATPAPDATLYQVGASIAALVDGVLTQVWDSTPRDLVDAQARLIAVSKAAASAGILAAAPEVKQRNAALGLLDPSEVDAIKTAIQAWRAAQNDYEAAVMACQIFGDLLTVPPPTWP